VQSSRNRCFEGRPHGRRETVLPLHALDLLITLRGTHLRATCMSPVQHLPAALNGGLRRSVWISVGGRAALAATVCGGNHQHAAVHFIVRHQSLACKRF